MRKFTLTLLLSSLCVLLLAPAAGQSRYTNPVIPGFNPDPSICRVGDDYYLATSSFEYFPGIPIYHSRDLVHWQMIGHALDRPSQLDLDGIKCSGGIYAPTLRYHNGTFYVASTLTGKGGNFIVTATNPAGPWSEPHWIEGAPGIDPTLFFDEDGRVYFCGTNGARNKVFPSHNNIWIQQLDTTDWKLIGPQVEVIDGAAFYKSDSRMDGGLESAMNNYEGPHLYKKGDRYYMIVAHGGTARNHAASIWCSDNVFGPYTSCPQNPILTHRDLSADFVFTSTGHADLVETQNGEWWMVFLANRPLDGSIILGRETLLVPVDWSGQWPVVNPDGYRGRAEISYPVPDLPEAVVPGFPQRDDFNDSMLRPEWTFIRTPRTQWWSLNEKKGFLRMYLRPESISDQAQPSFIGLRQQHFDFTATAKFQFHPKNPNEEAGLVVERDKDHYFKFVIGYNDGKPQITLVQKALGTAERVVAAAVPGKSIGYFRVVGDGYFYSFSYSSDAKKWMPLADRVDGKFLGAPQAGRFTGTFIGMYASSNGQASTNFVDFDWFEYQPNL